MAKIQKKYYKNQAPFDRFVDWCFFYLEQLKNQIDMEKAGYFSFIPASVRYDARLKANEKLLFGELINLANEKGIITITNGELAARFGVAKETISRWLSHLAKVGYIEILLIKNKSNQIIERKIILK